MAVKLSALRAGRPLLPRIFLVLICIRGWVDPSVIVRLEGLGKLKIAVWQHYIKSRDSSVGTATAYGLDGRVQFPAWIRYLYLLHNAQTGFGAHLVFYQMDKGEAAFPVAERPGREADHSPPSNVEIKNIGAITAFSYMSTWRGD
jgi:hypothetical protein